ncbi:MAG: hypothetical protein FWG66_05660 [Spirochaetes bacterium]|nr:hypothetical protein [Spirochaetota bacterium]
MVKCPHWERNNNFLQKNKPQAPKPGGRPLALREKPPNRTAARWLGLARASSPGKGVANHGAGAKQELADQAGNAQSLLAA